MRRPVPYRRRAYYFSWAAKAPPDAELLAFRDARQVAVLLQAMSRGAGVARALREALARRGVREVSRLTDAEVAEEVARRVANGQLSVYRAPIRELPFEAGVEEEEKPAAAEAEEQEYLLAYVDTEEESGALDASLEGAADEGEIEAWVEGAPDAGELDAEVAGAPDEGDLDAEVAGEPSPEELDAEISGDMPTEDDAAGAGTGEAPAGDSAAGASASAAASAGPAREGGGAPSSTWIEIALVGEDDGPIAGVKYRLELPDGRVVEGTLGADGRARVDGVASGSCKVTFPEIDTEAVAAK